VLAVDSTESRIPITPPEQAGPRIVATFFVEFIPGVENEYELLKKACAGPPKIGLPDLQMETLIFGLHCLDRAVFVIWGADYRNAFMDYALAFAEEAFAAVLPEHIKEHFLEHLRDRYNMRQAEHAAMAPLPEKDASPKGTLFWEYAKYICLEAGADPVVLPTFLKEASAIFTMMNKIAQTL